MPAEYYVEKANLDRDREEILAVAKRNEVSTEPSRYFAWWFENNPFGQGSCWLLRHGPTRSVVGTIGVGVRRMKIGESAGLVGRAGFLGIDAEHRFLGPALMLQQAMLDALGDAKLRLVYTMAPPRASSVFKRLNFRSLGKLDCRRKIISVSSFVENRLTVFPGFARKFLASLLDLGIHVASRETWSRLGKARMLRIHDFDDRFDDLWDRAAPLYSFTTERSSAFLRWRFVNNPAPRKFVCDALCHEDGTLHGYAVYHVDQHDIAHVVDLFAEDQGPATIALAIGLVGLWRSNGITSAILNAIGSERFFDVLGRVGFSDRWAYSPPPYELFVSKPSDVLPQTSPLELNWGFTLAEDFHS